MDDLPLPQEADGCDDIGVIDETKDVIVGSAGFLLGGHILAQVGDGITGGLHGGGGEGHAAGGLRPDANGVIDEVGCEAGIFDLFDGEIPGELVDDGADHLQMSQLYCTLMMDIKKTTERKIAMNTLGKLEQLLLAGEITEDEYKERKEVYVETILEIYCLGIITKEQMYEKLNE